MKPYYKTDNGKLYCGDVVETLQKLESNSVEAIVTDPPYGIASEVNITRGRNQMKFKGKNISHDFGEWDKFDSLDDYLQWTFSWVDECIRVLKKGRMFISFFDRDKINFLSKYLQDKGFKCKGYFAFIKSNPVPQARKVKWMNGWEEAGLWQKKGGKLVFNYELGQHKDYKKHSICSGKERTEHPTQKPLQIISPFVKYWTEKEDLILDPFLGSGTTGLVAEKLNRNWIGIDLNEEYCEIAKQRIKQEADQEKLF